MLNTDRRTSAERRVEQSVRPFISKQLNKATQTSADSAFVVDGHDVKTVIYVGCIVVVDESEVFYSVSVHDGYGTVDVRLYKRENDKRVDLQPGRFVRCVGELRSFDSDTFLLAHVVRPVLQFDDVVHHILSALHLHLSSTKKQVAIVESGLDLGTPIRNAFWHVMRETKYGDEGLNRFHLYADARKIVPGVSNDVFDRELQWMLNSGHMYATIDDDHFSYPQ